MKGWTNLGVVDTIYEDEDYEYTSSSSSSSPSLRRINLFSPSTPLNSRVQEWTLAKGSMPDVLIHVKGTSFRLHKDPLIRRSGYLKRQLTGFSELTLSPPLNITVETFSLVADFCYGAHVQLTPLNLVFLRVAAEQLLMTETDGDGRENLRQVTESYFRRVVAINLDHTRVVLRSCLALLPESETMAFLVGRCIQALTLTEDGDGIDDFLGDAFRLNAADFVIVAEAVQRRFPRHDLLYRIVDAYVKEQDGKITEEDKVMVCSSIDCGKLSPPILLHAVQNPKMPLRFIVRAMLQEQLNTRRSILSVDTSGNREIAAARSSSVTLGSLLQRDSAARQTARLRATMESTSSRIESLEKELDAMRKLISEESEKQRNDGLGSRSVMDSGRSASFNGVIEGKIERGERGSMSTVSRTWRRGVAPASSSGGSSSKRSNIGRRLIKGIKSAMWGSKETSKRNTFTIDEIYDGLEDFVWIRDEEDERNSPSHSFNHHTNSYF